VIDFKYHVVSIVAVFLALAVGIVLGTNVLSGDVLKNLKAETTQLRKDSQDLLNQDQSFGDALEPVVVSGRLRHQRVAVVLLPGASKSVRDGIVKTLTSAGATVTAQVDIADPYVDPTQQSTLDDLVQSLAPTTLDLTGDTTVSTRAAAVVASALVVPVSAEAAQASESAGTAALTGPAGSVGAAPVVSTEPIAGATPSGTTGATAGTTESPATSAFATPTPTPSSAPTNLPVPVDPGSVAVLAGLQKAGFVKLDQTPTEFATLAVIVAPMPPTKPAAGATAAAAATSTTTASLDLIGALEDTGSGSVVAGATGSAASGGLLAQLRTDARFTKTVSGVDDVDTSAGQIALVFATAVEATGRAGQYGTGTGADAPLPTPPTATATPAAQLTPSP
jgi:hypothetical protein